MRLLDAVKVRVRQWMERGSAEARMAEEIRFHLEMETDRLVRGGVETVEARRLATLAFGGVEGHKESLRQGCRIPLIEDVLRDIRHGARGLRRSPGFTLAAVLTLALGIGANTTIFSAANAILLRPADAADPGRLVRINQGEHSPPSFDWYRSIRSEARSFNGVVGELDASLALGTPSGNLPVTALLVSSDYFGVLGIGAALGGVSFAPEDAPPEPAVVISYRLWEETFGADPNVVGTGIRLNGRVYPVIGVARRGFGGPYPGIAPDVWLPLSEMYPLLGLNPETYQGSLYVSGRLADGVSRDRAQAEMDVFSTVLASTAGAEVEPERLRLDHSRGAATELRGTAGLASALLLFVVGLVLLVACVNVANLLLARGMSRQREVGIRLALGVSRRRLVWQLLTESVLLALVGGAVALMLTIWTTGLLHRFLPPDLPIQIDLRPDIRVLLYAFTVSMGTVLVFGLFPALRASSSGVALAIRDEISGPHRSASRGLFIAAQVSLAFVLLSGAVLFLRSLSVAQKMEPGFDPNGVVTLRFDLEQSTIGSEEGPMFYQRLVETVEELGMAGSTTLARVIPLSGSNMEQRFYVEGPEGSTTGVSYFNVIGERYFQTLRIPVLEGREFLPSDVDGSMPVVIVNQSFAERHWPGGAVGQQLGIDGVGGPSGTVVGVVADAKYVTLRDDPQPTIYAPFSQRYSSSMVLHVRGSGNTATLIRALNESVAVLDPRIAVRSAKPMTEEMEISLLPARVAAVLLSIFGGLGLLLTGIGIHGVVSFWVHQRAKELAIRAAMGASRLQIVRLILSGYVKRVGVGLLLGMGLTLSLGQALSSLLYGVSPLDLSILLGVPLFILVTGLFATYGPARYGARGDLVTVLRST